MKTKSIVVFFVITLLSLQAISQQCETPFDLTEWSMKGTPNAHWKVLSPTEVIDTTWLFPASFFVSKHEYINVVIRGKVMVTRENDNDFIGLVFGYKEPTTLSEDNYYKFLLFDWKGANEDKNNDNIYEGFRLSSYNGYFTREYQQYYFVDQVENVPIRDLLDMKFGTGLAWEPFQEYNIELIYTSNKLQILVDSVSVFVRSGTFEKGKVGFYCMSQAYAKFSDFTYEQTISFEVSENSTCTNNNIDFFAFDPNTLDPPDFIDSLRWNFGDGNNSNLPQASHSYENDGLYDVKLIVYKNDYCIDTLEDKIRVYSYPEVDLGDDLEIPACSSVTLNPSSPDANYLWSTGQSTESIDLTSLIADTSIWIEVEKHGCTSNDTIDIRVLGTELTQIYFPNAFTPNNDGLNEVFKPVGNTAQLSAYNMVIYNRWGQQIFESVNPDMGWDGTYNGKLSQTGSYVYKVEYRIENCINFADHSELSTVMLLR